MDKHEFEQMLNDEGLRSAEGDEAGWSMTYINENGERITEWVTDGR